MVIIKYRSIFLSIAALMVLVSWGAIAYYGLNLGIDFTGGTLWQIKSTTDNRQLTTDNRKKYGSSKS